MAEKIVPEDVPIDEINKALENKKPCPEQAEFLVGSREIRVTYCRIGEKLLCDYKGPKRRFFEKNMCDYSIHHECKYKPEND